MNTVTRFTMKYPYTILFLGLFFGSLQNLTAQLMEPQEDVRPRYGIFADMNFNSHKADFNQLPGAERCDCPNFTGGNGMGYTAGIQAEFPVWENFLFGIRAGYAGSGATLKSIERGPNTSVLIRGTETQAAIEHSLTADIATLGLEPLLSYPLWDNLLLSAGGRFSYMLKNSFSQKETLIEPEDIGTFNNGKRTWNESAGDEIPGSRKFSAAAMLGVRYELPLNLQRTLVAAPEILYQYALTPVAESLPWKAHSLRAGVAILYSPFVEKAPEPEPEPVPAVPLPPEAPALWAGVYAFSLEPDGTEKPVARISVEEYTSLRMHPLLNYVFFEKNSPQIPVRYDSLHGESVRDFEIDRLGNLDALSVYHHLLNIVGRRMQLYPKATITLVGCNSDEDSEKGNTGLSRKRAEAVKDYLQKVWNIQEGRIAVTQRNLPEKPSNITKEDGIIENRRVEILSDTWEIIQPVLTHDTTRIFNPPVLRFRPQALAGAGLDRWALHAEKSGNQLRDFAGAGNVPDYLDWPLRKDSALIVKSLDDVNFSLNVADRSGQSYSTLPASLPVEVTRITKRRANAAGNKIIDRFSLILFDFDRPELNVNNKKVVSMIQPYILPESKVEITGHTDRMGEDDHNLELSQGRALQTAKAFTLPDETARGYGKSENFDNSLPEGRFYNRTVNINVETPAEEK